jgi:hypothetical protein
VSTPKANIQSDDGAAALLTGPSGNFGELGIFGRPWQEKNPKNLKKIFGPARPESAAVRPFDSCDVTCRWQRDRSSNLESKSGSTLSIRLTSPLAS